MVSRRLRRAGCMRLDFLRSRRQGNHSKRRRRRFIFWRRLRAALRIEARERVMAKPTTVKIKLVSSADTGFFYVTKKNPRNTTEKMSFNKYDPVVRKHVEFKEAKIK